MAIDAASPAPPSFLAELFDEAWEHGRKRRSRVLLLLVLLTVGGATVLFATSEGENHSVAGLGDRTAEASYRVCAADINGLWRYTYGAAACTTTGKVSRKLYSYYNLIVPAGATVDLTIARSRSAHSLRIAALGLTIATGASSAQNARFRVPRANETYTGQCSTGCLHDRTFAGTQVIAMTPEHYKRWVAALRAVERQTQGQLRQLRTALTRDGVLARSSSS